MKFNFMIAAALAGAAAVACRTAEVVPPRLDDGSEVQRLVAVLDYLSGDYPRAVHAGQPTTAAEYEEQVRFVQDARSLAARVIQAHDRTADPAQDPLARAVDDVAALVAAKADGPVVATRCQALKASVAERFGLRTSPTGRPDRARAQELYVQSCLACHGPTGRGDGERAAALDPHPANFHDPEVQAKLSPYRAYNALTFGVSGTSMPSFEALSPTDRWSLAFYALALGHESSEVSPAVPASMSLAELAWLSDADVVAELRRSGHAQPERALGYLRATAPFEEPTLGAGLADTRARLRRALAAYAAGQPAAADGLVLDAYLQGYEPLEVRLRARDAQGTAEVEQAFQSLRTSLHDREDGRAVRSRAATLDALLARAGGTERTFFPFVAAALIYLREGAEAALLVGALLAAVRKLGHAQASRDVHRGWIAALPAGVVTWWALERLLAQGSAERELVEAATSLAAAAVLFWVSYWLISKAESRRWATYLKQSVARSAAGRDRLLLFSMSFLAVYREAAETVLFTQALLVESGAQRAQVWAGAAAGLSAVIVLAVLMRRAVLSLPIGPFFAVSSLLLCLLAVSFAGAGLYELIAAGYVTPHPVHFPEIGWMGVHGDIVVLLVQSLIMAAILAAGLHTLMGSRVGAPSREGR
jgi:high-affinity iron transporter